jgi:drug/metabolite transporter (DMT)-like permease
MSLSTAAVARRARAIHERGETATLVAFLLAVVLGGIGPVMTRITLSEMPPMWGGAFRFSLAAILLAVIVVARGVPLPRGRALVGTIMFGSLGMGLSTILIYRGLVDAPAGVSQVILALVPLETFLFALVLRIERFRFAGLVGAALAVIGVGVVFGDQLSANVPIGGLLSILAAGISIASTTVVLKRFPTSHPLSAAAVALPIGALMFWAASIAFGEPRPLPTSQSVWLALAWLVFVGTLGVMTLFLFVIQRLSASTASYQFLLLPLVTVLVSAVVTGEQITPAFLVGAAIVLAGVYIGIIRSAGRSTPVAASSSVPAAVSPVTVE